MTKLLIWSFQQSHPPTRVKVQLVQCTASYQVCLILTHLNLATHQHGMLKYHLKTLQPNTSLSLKFLALKMVMLMALSRSADFSPLSVKHYRVSPEDLHSTLQSHRLDKEVLSGNDPQWDTLQQVQGGWIDLNSDNRATLYEPSFVPGGKLVILWRIKPHTCNSVTSCSIARWFKTVLALSGIDMAIFKAEVPQCQQPLNIGNSTKEILIVPWSQCSKSTTTHQFTTVFTKAVWVVRHKGRAGTYTPCTELQQMLQTQSSNEWYMTVSCLITI